MVFRTHVRPFAANREGVTLLELLVVLTIVAFMLSLGASGLSKAAAARSTTNSRDTYIWMARRARGTAVQRGQTVRLAVYASSGMAKITTASGTVLDQQFFKSANSTTVTLSSGDSIVICYTPRGYGQSVGCSVGLPGTVTFTRGPRTAVATAAVLGQVQAQ